MTSRAPILAGVFLMGLYTGAQNFMAGGGTFITYPILVLLGLDPVTASMTSALGLYPNQISSALASRARSEGLPSLPLRALMAVSVTGGAIGALLLVETPSAFFSRLVPWLMLFATIVFAWGTRHAPISTKNRMPRWGILVIQFCTAVYGGYFAAGIGFLMLATLTMNGQPTRVAIATKNVLVLVMTSASFVIFTMAARAVWPVVVSLAGGALLGSWLGNWLLQRIPIRWLRIYVVTLGGGLSIWLFMR